MADEAGGSTPPVTVDPTVQTVPAIDPTENETEGTAQRAGSGITPIFAPVPFRHTQLGWGLFLLGGAIHRFDADTTIKPSTGMAGGFYSENGSWGLMAIEMARLARDRWRVRGNLMHMDVRYDFYGIGEDAGNAGRSVGIDQTMDMVNVGVLRRVTPGFYGGGALIWIRSSARLTGDHGLPAPPTAGELASANLLAPGVLAEYDTRDNDYWPTRGSRAVAKGSFFTSGLGSERDFQRYMAAWSWYKGLRGRALVIATNALITAAAGDVPFWAVPSVGAGLYGLRGYQQGRYRDDFVTTAQAELRVHSEGRWGATGFAGIAQVAPAFADLWSAQVLPAGGVGARFQLTRQYPMHLRADYAWGRNGGIFYFSVSEAF